MIKKLNTDDIASILKIKNHAFKKSRFKDLGQWVQFLMQNINNKKVLMLGRLDDKSLLYLVCIFYKEKAFLIYCSGKILNNSEFKKMSLEWAKENGVDKIFLGKSDDQKIWSNL